MWLLKASLIIPNFLIDWIEARDAIVKIAVKDFAEGTRYRGSNYAVERLMKRGQKGERIRKREKNK
jgi:hypothetical protein